MALNLRVRPEGQLGKQSLYMPTNMQPLARSLVIDRPASTNRFDPGFSPAAPLLGPSVTAGGVPLDSRNVTYTVEVPFRAGQADTIPLPLGTIVWLDDPAVNRKLKGRRAITILNEDTAIGLRWSFSNGVANGALMLAGGNISFPADTHVNLYAITLNPAGGNLSLVQYA